ncbi:MAG: hypothetical protein KAK04_01035, partial [Cyclobacteriaceae bacterium]|nr:hypothetical protein [Cyclobacteriaceae bacterium]
TQIMKTNIKKITYFPLILVLLAFFSCEDNSGQIENLTKENTELNDQYKSQLLETRMVTKEADSLTTVVHKLQSRVNKLAGEVPVYKASNQEEEAIEALVNNIHKGWASMTKTNDTNELLQYFLPKYTTSTVRINTENIPSVQRNNDSNFEEHLQELMLGNNISISFGQTKFLYTEVKDKFFVTSFRTRIRVYNNDKQVHTSSLVTQLAGENKDGWKVGSYSWVTFNY